MSGHADRLVQRVMAAAGRRPGPGPCPDVELLSLYAERMLDEGERQGVEAHVVDCARCQATLAAFVRGALEEAPVPGGTAAGEARGDDGSRTPWWMGWRWLVPVAATAAVVTVAVWVMRPARPELTMTSVDQAAPVSTAAPRAAPTPAKAPSTVSAVAPAVEPAAPPAAGLADTRERQAPGSAGSVLRADRAVAAPPPPPAPLAPPVAAREREEPAPAAVAETVTTATAKVAAADGGLGRGARAEAAAPQAANRVPQMAELTGRITYRTRQALPAGAVVEARLLDVSRADAPADVIGRVEIVTRGEQVPLPFTLRHDASRIDPSRRYTVQVTITIDGRVRFRTTTAHAVLTSGAPAANVEVVVEPVP